MSSHQPSSPDPIRPDRPRAPSVDLAPAIAECARAGQQLVDVPVVERDLAWHVKAAYIGDLSALALATVRAEPLPHAA
jgi:hypothetical protein